MTHYMTATLLFEEWKVQRHGKGMKGGGKFKGKTDAEAAAEDEARGKNDAMRWKARAKQILKGSLRGMHTDAYKRGLAEGLGEREALEKARETPPKAEPKAEPKAPPKAGTELAKRPLAELAAEIAASRAATKKLAAELGADTEAALVVPAKRDGEEWLVHRSTAGEGWQATRFDHGEVAGHVAGEDKGKLLERLGLDYGTDLAKAKPALADGAKGKPKAEAPKAEPAPKATDDHESRMGALEKALPNGWTLDRWSDAVVDVRDEAGASIGSIVAPLGGSTPWTATVSEGYGLQAKARELAESTDPADLVKALEADHAAREAELAQENAEAAKQARETWERIKADEAKPKAEPAGRKAGIDMTPDEREAEYERQRAAAKAARAAREAPKALAEPESPKAPPPELADEPPARKRGPDPTRQAAGYKAAEKRSERREKLIDNAAGYVDPGDEEAFRDWARVAVTAKGWTENRYEALAEKFGEDRDGIVGRWHEKIDKIAHEQGADDHTLYAVARDIADADEGVRAALDYWERTGKGRADLRDALAEAGVNYKKAARQQKAMAAQEPSAPAALPPGDWSFSDDLFLAAWSRALLLSARGLAA